MTKIPRPITLIIMDGFGLNPELKGNAVAAAYKPNYERLIAGYPHTKLNTSGLAVGLPEGQMGNSEVGHLNLGAGRIVYQEVTRIDKSIAYGDFFSTSAFIELIYYLKRNAGKLHLLGLASDGLVHSSLEHLYGLLKLCKMHHFSNVVIHAFLDGRDTSPTGGVGFIEDINEKCLEIGVGRLGTIIGRYYAMDRDKRWPRIEKAYNLISFGMGLSTSDPCQTIANYYSQNITDEFMEPISVHGFEHTLGKNDGAIFYNFRADRARQLSYALAHKDFDGFPRNGGPVIPLVTMTLYDVDLKATVAFPQHHLTELFGEIICRKGLRQLRTAETEKYPHVTFFFNGGVERSFAGEERILIPSPKVATYDLKPEMSAYELTESTLAQISKGIFDVIIMNYANCDMVGHSGIFKAVQQAVEVVDICVGRIVEAVRKAGGICLITADHGNAEKLIDDDGSPFTAHTTFPVPFILVDDSFKGTLLDGGKLADIAPTMLEYLNIERPSEMTGMSLLSLN